MTLPRSRATGPEALVAAPDNSTGVFGSLRYSRHAGTEMLLIYGGSTARLSATRWPRATTRTRPACWTGVSRSACAPGAI